jgi:hypothetical protein
MHSFPIPHTVATDPGTAWTKDPDPAIPPPPDQPDDLSPAAQWPADALRTGLYGTVTPNVITLPDGSYRMYYTQILPRPGNPTGANDYSNATTRILSAISPDGARWTPEPGIRLTPQDGGAGDFRVVSPEVVPMLADNSRLRIYYESCLGTQAEPSPIRSAISDDGGLSWTMEAGVRLGASGGSFNAPRVVFLEDGRVRLYCSERGKGIISAVSDDGFSFTQEHGLRIESGKTYDALTAFAPEVLHIDNGGYRMYYAGYSAPNRAYVLSALSADGLTWEKEDKPVIAPGSRWDGAKCSEMCVMTLPDSAAQPLHYRMFYEACDGTAKDERGVWRIASATATVSR